MAEKKGSSILIAIIVIIIVIVATGAGVYYIYHDYKTTPLEPIVGGDRDSHGCIGSAGYSWCEAKQKCLRPWEEPCVATNQPSITVLSPKGGETWTPDNIPEISWTYNGIYESSRIWISIVNYDNSKVCPIIEGNISVNAGSLTLASMDGSIVDYSSCTSTGNKMKVRITFKGNKTTIPNYDVTGESANYFTITQ